MITRSVELVVALDRDGNWSVGRTREEATSSYDEQWGDPDDAGLSFHVIDGSIKLPADKLWVDRTIEAPLDEWVAEFRSIDGVTRTQVIDLRLKVQSGEVEDDPRVELLNMGLTDHQYEACCQFMLGLHDG